MTFLKHLLGYLRERKKFWMIPILIFGVVFGGLLFLAQGTAISPLIYTIF